MNNYSWEIEYYDLPAVPMPRRTVFHKTQSATREFYEQSPQWLVKNNTITYIGGDAHGTGTAESLPAMRQHLEDKYCSGIHKIPKTISIIDPEGLTWVKEYPFPKVLKRSEDHSDVTLDETWLRQVSPKFYDKPDIDVKVWGKGILFLMLGLLAASFFV